MTGTSVSFSLPVSLSFFETFGWTPFDPRSRGLRDECAGTLANIKSGGGGEGRAVKGGSCDREDGPYIKTRFNTAPARPRLEGQKIKNKGATRAGFKGGPCDAERRDAPRLMNRPSNSDGSEWLGELASFVSSRCFPQKVPMKRERGVKVWRRRGGARGDGGKERTERDT